jgi:hypothetical protein
LASSAVAQHLHQAYLSLICEHENKLHQSTYFPGIEKLNILRTFCLHGAVPEEKTEALVKELVKYRLLDIAALVHGTASERNIKERGTVPFLEKLVRRLALQGLCYFETYLSPTGPCNDG